MISMARLAVYDLLQYLPIVVDGTKCNLLVSDDPKANIIHNKPTTALHGTELLILL